MLFIPPPGPELRLGPDPFVEEPRLVRRGPPARLRFDPPPRLPLVPARARSLRRRLGLALIAWGTRLAPPEPPTAPAPG